MRTEQEIAELFGAATIQTLVVLQNELKSEQNVRQLIVAKRYYEFCFGLDFSTDDIIRVSHYKAALQSYLIDALIRLLKI